MQDAKSAIRVARIDGGWAWSVFSGGDAPVAEGVAPAQDIAMETAWRAARSFAPAAAATYPEIYVEPAPADGGGRSWLGRPSRTVRAILERL